MDGLRLTLQLISIMGNCNYPVLSNSIHFL